MVAQGKPCPTTQPGTGQPWKAGHLPEERERLKQGQDISPQPQWAQRVYRERAFLAQPHLEVVAASAAAAMETPG